MKFFVLYMFLSFISILLIIALNYKDKKND